MAIQILYGPLLKPNSEMPYHHIHFSLTPFAFVSYSQSFPLFLLLISLRNRQDFVFPSSCLFYSFHSLRECSCNFEQKKEELTH